MGDMRTAIIAANPALAKLFLDARTMPYTKIPEELNFVKHYHAAALQRLKADGIVSIDGAALRMFSTSRRSCLGLKVSRIATQRLALRLKLRNLTKKPVEVVLPKGTFWHSTREWHQPLLLVSETRLTLKGGARRAIDLDTLGAASTYYCKDATPMELSAYQLVAVGDAKDALKDQPRLWQWLKRSLVLPMPANVAAMAGAPPVASELARDRDYERRCQQLDEKAAAGAAAAGAEAAAAEAAALAAALAAAREMVEEAERQRAVEVAAANEEERKAREARAKDEYAIVERSNVDPMFDGGGGTAAARGVPPWFVSLTTAEKLAAVRADKLGDWEAFNVWLRATYDADELAELTMEDEEDIEVYDKFRAVREAEEAKAAREQHLAKVLAARAPSLASQMPKEDTLDGIWEAAEHATAAAPAGTVLTPRGAVKKSSTAVKV